MKHTFQLFALLSAFLLGWPLAGMALTIKVVADNGQPLATAMVTVRPAERTAFDTSDNGYPQIEKAFQNFKEVSRFTPASGLVRFEDAFAQAVTVRVRQPGKKDAHFGPITTPNSDTGAIAIVLTAETDPVALAANKPANVWAAAVDLGDPERKKRFNMQCGFCHQQGAPGIRGDRDTKTWQDIVTRMIGYGSRLPSEDQKIVPQMLVDEYARLRAHPEALGEALPWSASLSGTTIEEVVVGDIYSQMHDMALHSNGRVYVGDNLNDRLWDVDPKTGQTIVHKLPHDPDDDLGGLIRARLKTFPKHEDYVSVHSMAVSPKDGHIFMTPSNQQRIIEYAPDTGKYTVHRINDGFYPHTIRFDQRERVWFTLALSNQVGMLDRSTGKFTLIDLESRSLRESITLAAIPTLFKLAANDWISLYKFPIDKISTGVPLPYGIDVTPDGVVWVARLHANDIVRIDPETFKTKSYPFPLMGPRRLRSDAHGNLWICAFPESAIVKLDPKTGVFTRVEMPTLPLGSDTPYSLAVDQERDIVWVTGTASDTVNAYHINEQRWDVFPLPRKRSFTREIDVAEDGSIYSSNGSFPSWHIEDAMPTLIHVKPPWTHD